MTNLKRLSIWDVSRFVLKGAPFSLRGIYAPWESLQVPPFPLVFTITSGVMFGLLTVIKAQPWQYHPFIWSHYLLALGLSSAVGIPPFIILNYVIGWWCKLIIRNFSGRSDTGVDYNLSAGRVLYFSTVFQPAAVGALVLSLALQQYFGYSTIFIMLSCTVVVVLSVARLLALFMSIRHETKKAFVPGAIAVLACLDIWVILWIVFHVVSVQIMS